MRKNNNGFSLIELLLVIAIIGVLATTGIAIYSKQSDDFKVNRTATQIQQILEAATAYYTDQGCWPNATNCPAGRPIPGLQKYLPTNTQMRNPWNFKYIYAPTADNLKFQVSIGTPNKMLAQRIAARLPSSLLQENCPSSNNTCVISETVLPGQIATASLSSNYQVTGIGNKSFSMKGSDTTTSLVTTPNFTCPPKWFPKIAIMINNISPRDSGNSCSNINSFVVSEISPQSVSCSGTSTFSCSFYMKIAGTRGDPNDVCFGVDKAGLGDANVSYMTYCCKPNAAGDDCAGPINELSTAK